MIAARLRRRVWRAVFAVAGGLDVDGALPPGGCVVVAAHRSHADAPALLAALDAAHAPAVAAAADYWFDRPLTSWFCRAVAAGFPVHRDGGGYSDLAAQRSVLQAGRAVVVFPAGSRRGDGTFRSGAFRLAQTCDVPVVPVHISGTRDLLQPDGRLRRARVSVTIGAPLTIKDPRAAASATQAALARRAQRAA